MVSDSNPDLEKASHLPFDLRRLHVPQGVVELWQRLAGVRHIALILLFSVALIQGILYLYLLPPWQHYDEPTHFEYAWLIANSGRVPAEEDIDRWMRREVAASMVDHNFYWNLPKPDFARPDYTIGLGILELNHPPAYYMLVSLPLRLVRHLDMTTQLYVARTASLLLFLLTIAIAVGIMKELLPTPHPLRWAVPLAVVLLPPFTHHMTAVSNDVGAVFATSLFLWGTTRTIRYGINLPNLAWLIGAGLLGLAMKSTAALSLVLVPVVLLLALWQQKGWRWRLFFAGAGGLALLFAVLFLDSGDAAYWYRYGEAGPQDERSRVEMLLAPGGYHALLMELAPGDRYRYLMSPLLPADVESIAGETVTVGGWVWANREIDAFAPGLLVGVKGSLGANHLAQPSRITPTPQFLTYEITVPEEASRVYYSLLVRAPEKLEEPIQIYLDRAFIVMGELSENERPTIEGNQLVTSDGTYRNLVRNPEGTKRGLRLRPWIQQLLKSYIGHLNRSPTFVLSAMLDVQVNGPVLMQIVLPQVVENFFTAFAWGHVRLDEPLWRYLAYLLFLLALMGAGRWLWKTGARPTTWPQPVIFFLALILIVMWGATLVWPLLYATGSPIIPAARYTYPSIIPTALLLVGGWWALPPERYRWAALYLLLTLFGLMNLAAVVTIWNFYRSIPVS